MRNSMIAAALLVAAPLAQAQVEVVDSQPLSSEERQARAESGSSGGNEVQMEMYFQLQALQQEVLELRGQVEEQSHEIQRLKQQRMEDYLDLDNRIAELQSGGLSGSLDVGAGSRVESGTGDERLTETQTYRDAYQLLRDREIDAAIAAFNSYLEEYPQGNFAGNSYYWLGEIYLLQDDLGQAQSWFERLLEDFPDDRKRTDTQYKLGRVYHQQGEEARAQRVLEDVAAGSSDAARLARQYLRDNF